MVDGDAPARGEMTNIYVIKADGYGYKIGIATRPKARLGQLRVGLPVEFTLLGHVPIADEYALRVEQVLHKRYHAHHIKGEWFNLPDRYWNERDFVKDVLGCASLLEKVKRAGDAQQKADARAAVERALALPG